MGSMNEADKSTSEGVRDLSEKLTADKIAALKNKRKKNMARNTIKNVDESVSSLVVVKVLFQQIVGIEQFACIFEVGELLVFMLKLF